MVIESFQGWWLSKAFEERGGSKWAQELSFIPPVNAVLDSGLDPKLVVEEAGGLEFSTKQVSQDGA